MALTTANCTTAENCTTAAIFYESATEEMWAQWNAVADYVGYQPWIFSLIGSAMVGLSGVLPLLVIPIDEGVDLKNGAGAGTLKILLSFAVGGLLGDVFLHLLPEAWASKALNIVQADGDRPMACGLWVLSGFLVFIIAEKIFIGEGEIDADDDDDDDDDDGNDDSRETDVCLNNNDDKQLENNNCLTLSVSSSKKNISKLRYSRDVDDPQSAAIGAKGRSNKAKNGYPIGIVDGTTSERYSSSEDRHDIRSNKKNNRTNLLVKRSVDSIGNKKLMRDETIDKKDMVRPTKPKPKRISGYLNLMANCIDNFTHGLAVGGSFLVSFRLGALTTFAILIHEIPHEVGDFAILLKSGFSRWDAARAQLLTATGGIVGALVAVLCSGSGVESRTSWILPFTAGGFLHIGMVTVLPELIKESNPMESAKQLGALLTGITVMAILTIFCD